MSVHIYGLPSTLVLLAVDTTLAFAAAWIMPKIALRVKRPRQRRQPGGQAPAARERFRGLPVSSRRA